MRPDWTVWVANGLLQWVLLTMVLRKNGWREHKAFALYIAYCSCKTSLLMWVALYHQPLYFSINSTARAVSVFLMIGVLLEVFAAVFRPYSTLPDGTLRWFRTALAGLILLAACAAFYFPGPAPGNLQNTVLLVDRSASMIFCGSFAFTALVSSYFGLPWKTRTFGIGAGFLLFMSVDLFVTSVGSVYGGEIARSLRYITMLGYSLALITWLTYFVIPDRECSPPTLDQVARLQKALDSAARKVESFPSTR